MSDSEKAEMGLSYGKRFGLGSQPERKTLNVSWSSFEEQNRRQKWSQRTGSFPHLSAEGLIASLGTSSTHRLSIAHHTISSIEVHPSHLLGHLQRGEEKKVRAMPGKTCQPTAVSYSKTLPPRHISL